MDREQIKALIERVEKATGTDRELDLAIYLALGLAELDDKGRPYCLENDFRMYFGNSGDPLLELPKLTASLDASIALVERVLPGAHVGLDPIFFENDHDLVKYDAIICRPNWHEWNPTDSEWIKRTEARHLHKPLAVLSAGLRALLSDTKEQGDG